MLGSSLSDLLDLGTQLEALGQARMASDAAQQIAAEVAAAELEAGLADSVAGCGPSVAAAAVGAEMSRLGDRLGSLELMQQRLTQAVGDVRAMLARLGRDAPSLFDAVLEGAPPASLASAVDRPSCGAVLDST